MDRVLENACAVRAKQTSLISGTGLQLGMEATWRLQVRPDGAYREEVVTEHVTYVCGYDGKASSSAWEIDSSGCLHTLRFDDHEASLLVMWIRTGVWVHPTMRSRLCIERVAMSHGGKKLNKNFSSHGQGEILEGSAGRAMQLNVRLRDGKLTAGVTIDTATWRPIELTIYFCGDMEQWRFLEWIQWEDKTYVVSNSERPVHAAMSPSDSVETLLKQKTHDAQSFGRDSSGSSSIDPLSHPRQLLHNSVNGGQQSLSVTSLRILDNRSGDDERTVDVLLDSMDVVRCLGMAPVDKLFPNDSVFLENAASEVPAYWTTSGHLVVQMTINEAASPSGWFILDSGASGFVIEPTAADALRLESFGDLHITGMSGKVQGRFRRAKTVQIGPLQITDAIFMEMSCSGLVSGGPGPVIGIVGQEVFRRSIISIPERPKGRLAAEKGETLNAAAAFAMTMNSVRSKKNRKSHHSSGNRPTKIFMFHPEDSDALNSMQNVIAAHHTQWFPVTMLASLPHIEVVMSTESGSCRTMLMVDTGAGGLDVMVNKSVAAQLWAEYGETGGSAAASASRVIRGVGGRDAPSMTMASSNLKSIFLGDRCSIEEVKCLVAPGGVGGGVELSYYSGGILCGGALSRFRMVFDMARQRLAIIDPTDDHKE